MPPPEPGPRPSTDTNAGFPWAAVKRDLHTVLGYLQSLGKILRSILAAPGARGKASGVESETPWTAPASVHRLSKSHAPANLYPTYLAGSHPNISKRQEETERTQAWKNHPTEDAPQRQGEVKRTEAWKSPLTEDAAQRQKEAERTEAWKSLQTEVWKSSRTEDAAQRQKEAKRIEAWKQGSR